MTKEITNAISKTKSELGKTPLPDQQGIYAFFINNADDLGKFGSKGQIIYVGLSEKSLNSRETKTHMMSGQTGWSSLRRSLGAILKFQLNLTALKRDKNSAKLHADKYRFDGDGETRLTEWMIKNLKMGYWTTENPLTLVKLREMEEETIIKLRPTLDLDKRTRKFNPLADELDNLRKICRDEVKRKNT